MIFKKSLGWNFPSNDDGQQNGLNDAGIETFKDNRLHSLAREVLQNSSDAAATATKKPVEVHFKLLEIPASEFPGVADFKKALQSCATHWKASKQTVAFCKEGLAVLAQPMLRMLKVSDFNTTGVRGASLGDINSDWFKLTKGVGASDKSEGKLGSFGIGKHAPFACSDLRTVFYGTKDDAGVTAFQGVCKLPSHKSKGFITQGPGYFGKKKGNKPLLDFSSLSPIFERDKTGADVYIMGFHPFPDWESSVIKSVIESFFVAIHAGQLTVKVEKTSLNRTSLPSHIKKHYAEPDSHFFADEYYSALVSEEGAEFSEDDFLGMGKIRLRVLENKAFKKKVAMLRRSGMKIFDKGHFQTPLRFSGVFTAEGEKLDALLRELEPPSHDQWKEDRGDDPAVSRKVLNKLYGWVNDKVRELVPTDGQTEVDAEGISQYLPDDIEDDPKGTPLIMETIHEEPAAFLDMRIRNTPMTSAPIFEPAAHTDSDEEEEGEGGGPDGPINETDGGGGGGGGGGNGGGTEATKKKGQSETHDNHKRVEIGKVRIYCSDPAAGKYRLLFEPQSGEATKLRVFIIGEVGSEAAPIKTFSVNGGPETDSPAEKGLVGPVKLEQGKRAALDVVLKDGLRCALGVVAYAD